jgi:hypothetical protein
MHLSKKSRCTARNLNIKPTVHHPLNPPPLPLLPGLYPSDTRRTLDNAIVLDSSSQNFKVENSVYFRDLTLPIPFTSFLWLESSSVFNTVPRRSFFSMYLSILVHSCLFVSLLATFVFVFFYPIHERAKENERFGSQYLLEMILDGLQGFLERRRIIKRRGGELCQDNCHVADTELAAALFSSC